MENLENVCDCGKSPCENCIDCKGDNSNSNEVGETNNENQKDASEEFER
ncbi:MAG: hypothetical protein PHV79_03885 [Clostridia bacterium]|jgi:hypothetical protein|nr:hypothetical protein [Clostridia bacterium]MDD3862971.1 hypothetical protein [Clostridia bacterium]MDD4408356.1 hypothetical protein [Clostridia bacterium]